MSARSLQEDAIVLAVVASVRHLDTDYDGILMRGVARDVARERIRPAIDAVLAAWRAPISEENLQVAGPTLGIADPLRPIVRPLKYLRTQIQTAGHSAEYMFD